MENKALVRMEHITKTFGATKALTDVDFDLREGEVHALLGENGSGKSTLIKVLGGIHKMDSGEIYLDDKKVEINSVKDADKYGISIVHQELSFAPMMTVAENIFMGREYANKAGFLDRKKIKEETKRQLQEFGSDIDPDTLMSKLSISQQQVVEIVKALSNNAKIIVMDEPSASLSLVEVARLYEAVDRLKAMGLSVIYVSHRMEELFRLSDRVTVLRDGIKIGTLNTKETNEDELVSMMVGRVIGTHYRDHEPGTEVALELKNLTRGEMVNNVSIHVNKGEVIGLSGIVGAGRSETARVVAGIDKGYKGQIFLNGEEIHIKKPTDAIDRGIVLVPEERKKQGLVLGETVMFNSTLCVLKKFIKFVGVNFKKQNEIADNMIEKLNIKVSSREQTVGSLSGGNQQKVVLAKWLATEPDVLILDEPTKGIDVGAKAEIYKMIDDMAKEGKSTIIISSDLTEILRVCDRVYVMRKGSVVAEFGKDELDEENIIRYATGVS